MRKVLLISNYKKNVGGISGQVDLLYDRLKQEGYQVGALGTRLNPLKRLLLPIVLIQKGIKFDIFHIHGCSYLGFFPIVLGVTIGKILKKKIIVTYHGGDADLFFQTYSNFVRFFLLKTNHNIVLSDFLGNIFKKHSIPFTIISNCIEFKENQYHERTIIRPRFISIRSLTPLYNVECIIKAFEIVQKKYKDSILYILGDGQDRTKLENLVKELNLENVFFIGRVKNEDIYNYLINSDILLSSPIIDNQPISILEAFNAGLLVISSRVGGVPFMVNENISGLLFESNNFIEMSKKMMYALENQNETMFMIKNAKEECLNYTWDIIRTKLLPLYE